MVKEKIIQAEVFVPFVIVFLDEVKKNVEWSFQHGRFAFILKNIGKAVDRCNLFIEEAECSVKSLKKGCHCNFVVVVIDEVQPILICGAEIEKMQVEKLSNLLNFLVAEKIPTRDNFKFQSANSVTFWKPSLKHGEKGLNP